MVEIGAGLTLLLRKPVGALPNRPREQLKRYASFYNLVLGHIAGGRLVAPGVMRESHRLAYIGVINISYNVLKATIFALARATFPSEMRFFKYR